MDAEQSRFLFDRGLEPSEDEYRKAVELDDFSSNEEYWEYWHEMFREDSYFFEVSCIENDYGFRTVFIRNRYVFEYDPQKRIF